MAESDPIPVYPISAFDKSAPHVKLFEIRRLEEHIQNIEFVHFPHRHNFYNLLFITQGSGTHDIDFKRYPIKPNVVFTMAPGQVHSWELSPDIHGYTIFFTTEFYAQQHNPERLLRLPFFQTSRSKPLVDLPPEAMEQAVAVLELMLQEYTSATMRYRNEITGSYLNTLLYMLSRYHESIPAEWEASKMAYAQVRNFERFIDIHFRSKKSVSEYAELLHLTPNHLNALCSKVVGKTASELIRERIILEAKRLLLHASLSISEVAYQLQFADNSYFSRFFKKYTGLTPEAFRKQPSSEQADNHNLHLQT